MTYVVRRRFFFFFFLAFSPEEGDGCCPADELSRLRILVTTVLFLSLFRWRVCGVKHERCIIRDFGISPPSG